jgi:hypothetical protein
MLEVGLAHVIQGNVLKPPLHGGMQPPEESGAELQPEGCGRTLGAPDPGGPASRPPSSSWLLDGPGPLSHRWLAQIFRVSGPFLISFAQISVYALSDGAF